MKPSWPARAVLGLIGGYRRWLSPLIPPSCRFVPTCSHYTYDAILRFGLRRGGWLGLKRVCRCHPWHPGGYDPVPEVGCEVESELEDETSKTKIVADEDAVHVEAE